MKVLFAFNNEEQVNQLVDYYRKTYGEKLDVTKVYFFRSLIDTLRKNKNFDRIIIHEELEPFGSKNQDAIDKYLFNNFDKVSDEAGKADIILICTERRQYNDKFISTLFNLGIYNFLCGQDRTFGKVSELITKPRTKKDAKTIIDVDLQENPYEASEKVDELELRNIIKYYERNIHSRDKIVSGFDSLYEQYTFEKLKQIVPWIPQEAREILEQDSPRYVTLMSQKTSKNSKGEKVKIVEVPVYIKEEPTVSLEAQEKLRQDAEKQAEEERLQREAEAKRKEEEERLQREAEAKRKEEEDRIREEAAAKQRAEQERLQKEAEAKQKAEEERLKQEAEAKRKAEEERLKQEAEAKQKAEEERLKQEAEAKQKAEEERLKQEAEAKQKAEEERLKQEAEAAKQKAEEERLKQEAEAKQKAEEERLKQEAEAAKQKAEEERLKQEAEAAKQKAEEENKHQGPELIRPVIPKVEPEVIKPSSDPQPAQPNYAQRYQPTRPVVEEPRIQTVTQVIEKEVIQEVYSTPRDYRKAVCFVGAHKTGTTFIINAIANVLTSKGIKVAILDLTYNRDSYLIYTNRDLDQQDIAANSLNNLAIGQDRPFRLGNLSVYTGVPRMSKNRLDVYKAIEIAKREHSVILIDCDFTTKKDVPDVFRYAQSIYVVQDMDTLNILPITMFLKELKGIDVDITKISVIINKYLKCSVKKEDIIGALSYYTSPDLSVMEALLPKNVRSFIIPFDEQNYLRYIENVSTCKMNFSGFSENFKQALSILIQDVFPIGTSGHHIPRPSDEGGFMKSIFKKR